jgi:type II secretory pathway component PulF
VEAADEAAARKQLEGDGAVVLAVRRRLSLGGWERTPTDRELAVWVRDLAVLLRTGVPMLDALALAGEPRGPLVNAAAGLAERIREGQSLSQAVRNARGIFPESLAAGIRAGEISGDLPGVLERTAVDLEHAASLRERLRAALVYPAVLATLACVVLGFLVGYVVPSFAGVLAEGHGKLPAVTRWVLGLAELARHHGWLILVAVGLAVAGLRAAHRRAETGMKLDRAMLRLPWVGPLVQRAEGAAWARTLGMLVAGTVPLAEALELAASGVDNRHLASRLAGMRPAVEEGARLAAAAAATGVLAERTVRVLTVGQETGELARMLSELSRMESEAVRGKLELATRLLEPALMLVMGLVVAVVLVAMFLPIVEMAATL